MSKTKIDPYKVHDPGGWYGDATRGAAMGRTSYHQLGYTGTLHVAHVKLNSGGYDRLGTYWGLGQQLYWVHSPDLKVDYCCRAMDRVQACNKARETYPDAKVRE